jgi:hypothetical protein
MLLVDGHVEYVQLTKLFSKEDASRKRWNFDNSPSGLPER